MHVSYTGTTIREHDIFILKIWLYLFSVRGGKFVCLPISYIKRVQ